ncbi:fluoride efflux transporter CrcB [Halomonas saccharevitans]|uniref:Fluoride-specific ion channel FluC n=1 Tax=Halomonas saccharevitans TaxID=416872 RepID=A0A1I6YMH4_9GAMM|nr:fluoride efflux transporter CrcB [Halomonas saccharevitans]MDT8878973.1 fluoride efflux transporter CrcB [Halomonas saccharevitans]SFT51676.1 CrcB protein [Halomonas saccharevitans]
MSIDSLTLLAVAAGGGLGGMARLALGDVVARRLGAGLPWGTLAVNLSGALLMGLLAGLLEPTASGPAWSLAAIGLLGGYTTVSSFSLQTLTLARQGRRAAALVNVLTTLVAGFAALLAGAWLSGGLS